MVPYQLSEPTTCQPRWDACDATRPARPETLELLKTETGNFDRSKNLKTFKTSLSFLDDYSSVHLLDVEWLLSTLFDASLFRL